MMKRGKYQSKRRSTGLLKNHQTLERKVRRLKEDNTWKKRHLKMKSRMKKNTENGERK